MKSVYLSARQLAKIGLLICTSVATAPSFCMPIGEEASKSIVDQMQSWQTEFGLPSLSLAISLNDEVVFADAIGYADVAKQIPATEATLYSVGSIAKPMTALALARLIDQDKLSFEQSVSKTLREYPQFDRITLRQLASHTAGIGRPWEARDTLEFKQPKDRTSPFEVLDIFVEEPLSFTPGESFEYTSMGYVLLSALLERAAPTNYLDLMQEQVFAPLGMSNTRLDDSSVPNNQEASYYKNIEDSERFTLANEARDRSFLFGAGGYVSTPSDLVKMASAFSVNGFISEAVKQQLMMPVKIKSGEINPQGYGLGWRISEIADPFDADAKITAIHHGGVTSGAATGFVLIVPKYRAAIAYTTNIDPDNFWRVRQESLGVLLKLIQRPKGAPQ